MNGYEMMADSYRQLVKQGKIDKETADREIHYTTTRGNWELRPE